MSYWAKEAKYKTNGAVFERMLLVTRHKKPHLRWLLNENEFSYNYKN